MVLHPCVTAINDRLASINKALGNGTLTREQGRHLGENYAFVYKDGPTPVLGIGRSGSAEPAKSTEYTDKYTIPFVISAQIEDRDGDVVRSRGVQYKNFSRSPGVFFGHQEWEIPIGQARATDGRILFWTDDTQVKSACRFDHTDSDAMLVYNKVIGGFLNSTSLAFVPIQAWRRDRHQEKGIYDSDWHKAKPHHEPNQEAGWWFEDCDATEWSVVGVGSCPAALRDIGDREKSFMSPRLQKAWKTYSAKSINESGGCFTGPDGITWCPLEKKESKAVVKKDCGCNDCVEHKPCPCNKQSSEVIWKPNNDKVKPEGCTCKNYPTVKMRNGSGHEPSCPHHKSWQDQGGFNRNKQTTPVKKGTNDPTNPGGRRIIPAATPNITINPAQSTVASNVGQNATARLTINTGHWPSAPTRRFIDYLRTMKYKVTPILGSSGNAAHVTIEGNRNRIHDDIRTAQRWIDPLESFTKSLVTKRHTGNHDSSDYGHKETYTIRRVGNKWWVCDINGKRVHGPYETDREAIAVIEDILEGTYKKALTQADMESCRGQAGEIDRTKASDMGDRKLHQGDRVLISNGQHKGKQGTIKSINGDTVTIVGSMGETVEVPARNLTSLSPLKSVKSAVTKRDSRQVKYVSSNPTTNIQPDEEGWYIFENGEMVDGPYDSKQEAEHRSGLVKSYQRRRRVV